MKNLSNQDFLALIYKFLKDLKIEGKDFAKLAELLKKNGGIEPENLTGGIASKKFKRICKFYIKSHPKLLEYHSNKVEEEEEEENVEEEEILENNEAEAELEVEEKVVPLKNKKQDPKKIEEEIELKQEEDEEEEDEEDTRPAFKNNSTSNGVAKVDSVNSVITVPISNYSKPIQKNFFQRIDNSRIHNLKDELKDNSFHAKFKFGQGGDEFGKLGHERLKDTRGRSFKKEKSKMKNKSFQGGGFKIDMNARNSIKL